MTKIAFIVGEPSGDRIGADLIVYLRKKLADDLEVSGLGGEAMEAQGLISLFDIEELSIIGIGAIVSRLPQLMRRVSQTAKAVIEAEPDALVVIDSPTFSHRIAKRLRKARPHIPIINYIPPTVWAWREERAEKMRPYIDHAICTFPFEPEFYERLNGPPATYVGHPILKEPHLAPLLATPLGKRPPANPPRLVILPGSRRGEIDRLLADFGRTFERLNETLPGIEGVIPTLPRHRARVESEVFTWRHQPRVVTGHDERWAAFASADAALAASGTVSLELALAGLPMALAYRLDPVGYRFRHLITAWTAALPNFIAGHPLVPEHFHEIVRPEHLARRLERLLTDTPERRAQIEGFKDIREKMTIDRAPGEAAAEIVLDTMRRRAAIPNP
ncbi:lipid-A-disaccharide synthase [Fulvimarina pelagi HTCC2506]|uniref:Lipid-A-disaccharide synthase n=1 Tax=Fulvimarina pelagi HTCC2506 TaxID=314231 RepID=Q0G6E6_9HYPH|nr:lipid-A-disaccharide synthase [Fulvimarina pelagi]EAU42768.1 lipid-A-disaccharide synthase [Fulvimarina pelagi HTCC2506]